MSSLGDIVYVYVVYVYTYILLNLFTTPNMLLSSLGLLLSSGCASKLFVLLSLFCKLNKNTLKANLHDQLLHHHYLPSTPAVLVSCNLCESEKKQQIKSVVPDNKRCTHMTWWKKQCSLLQQYLNMTVDPNMLWQNPHVVQFLMWHVVTLACYRDDTLCFNSLIHTRQLCVQTTLNTQLSIPCVDIKEILCY